MKVNKMEHKSLKENMSNMTTKEKMIYIWYYYKFHIVISIVAIILVASFVVQTITTKGTAFDVVLLGKYADTTKIDTIANKMTKDIINDNRKEMKIDFLTVSDDNQEYTQASMQKLTAMLAAKDIDVLILDKTSFETYAKQHMFLKLTSIPNYSKLNLNGHDAIKYKLDDDKQEETYGISLDNLPILKQISYDSTNKILCVTSNSERLDKASATINWILNYK
jgi:hypothetical protein